MLHDPDLDRGSLAPEHVSIAEEDKAADTVLKTKPETLQAILDGTQDPNMAVLMGKMKLQGNIGVAMKLASMLED